MGPGQPTLIEKPTTSWKSLLSGRLPSSPGNLLKASGAPRGSFSATARVLPIEEADPSILDALLKGTVDDPEICEVDR